MTLVPVVKTEQAHDRIAIFKGYGPGYSRACAVLVAQFFDEGLNSLRILKHRAIKLLHLPVATEDEDVSRIRGSQPAQSKTRRREGWKR